MKSLSFSRSHYLFRNWTMNRLSVPGIHYLLRQLWIHFLLHDFTFYFAKILFTFYFTDSLFYFASISQIYHQSTIYLASLPWIHYIFREFTMNIASILRINFETNLLWILLWILLVFRVYTTNSLSITRFTLNSLRISRIYFDFTMNSLGVLRIHYCRFHGKGFLQTQTWKNKIAWFASSCWLCFSSNPWLANILNREFCWSLLANQDRKRKRVSRRRRTRQSYLSGLGL